MSFYDLSPAKLYEDNSVKRFQHWLDTGEWDDAYNRTWDMLAWLEWNKKQNV